MALQKMQGMYGIIPNIKSKGLGAKKVLQKLFHLRVEEDGAGNVGGSRNSSNNNEGSARGGNTGSSSLLKNGSGGGAGAASEFSASSVGGLGSRVAMPSRSDIDTLVMYV
jgi:hypothetical protein